MGDAAYEMRRQHEREIGKRVLAALVSDEPEMLTANMTWRGTYREIDYKISLWGLGSMCDGHGMWNYYLFLREQQFGKEAFEPLWLEPSYDDKSRAHFDYFVSPFTELKLHGGITYYEQHGQAARGARVVEIGCDYGHLWDRDANYGYTLRSVRHDAERSIDLLLRLYPALLVKCSWDGTYHPRDEMLANKHGHLVWRENRNKIPADWNWFDSPATEGRTDDASRTALAVPPDTNEANQ